MARLPGNAHVIALCIEGRTLPSEQLTKEMETAALTGKNNLAFIIGGSFGLSEQVKQKANLRLSMSPMTFPHQLARLLLLEQIYRAFSISAGSKYHK